MKKNKLFTVLAAVALLGSTGASLVESNAPVVQAAKKSKKKVKKSKKKTAKYAYVRTKRNAYVYKVTINKRGDKISRVSNYKRKGKKQVFKSGLKFVPQFSFKYKKTNYYYLGSNLAVRSRDVKRLNKKSIPTLTSLVKKAKAARKAKVDNWNKKINEAAPKGYGATIKEDTQYYVYNDSSKKFELSSDKLTKGSEIVVLYKQDVPNKDNSSTIPFYFAMNTANKKMLIPVEEVTLKNSSASVPDENAFSTAYKNYTDIIAAAKKDLGITTN